MATTKKPTGLKITRNNGVFGASWKIADTDYGDGQSFQYKVTGGKWIDVSVGKSVTSKSVTLRNADYYPNSGKKKLTSLSIRIRGNRKKYTSKGKSINPSVSDWASKSFDIKPPKQPTVTATLSSSQTNVTNFAWSTGVASGDAYWLTDVKWESILVKECNATDGSKLPWKSSTLGWLTGTGSAAGSRVVTEDTSVLANGSYTRWFRICSRGPAGDSAWRYAKHVYAFPKQARINYKTAVDNGAGGYKVTVKWTADSDAAHPIDSTTVQYAVAVPAAGLTCPSGASWSDANESRDTSGQDAAVFVISDTLDENECLFVKVNTKHDSSITESAVALVKTGFLADPSNVSVQTDDSTFNATISATNNAGNVPDSFLQVFYRPASDPQGTFTVGIIPHGDSSVTVQCPDWSGEMGVSFGVRACVGDYTAIARADGASSYAVTSKMASENTVWRGGTVPTAPNNVALSATDISGTIQVTWDWTWQEANGAEISWADHEDAWESTDEPSTYTISRLHASRWNISGLATGMRWYVRVRLFSENNDSVTYGPWSDMKTIDLSSAPSIPTLMLSDSIIPADGNVTASWVYVTTDGTAQSYAEICEAQISSDGITYGEIIAHTETAQHITISAESAGWGSGETHNLCVRVVSASGRTSDSWSEPVSVTVADPINASITSHSFVNTTVPLDEEEETTRTVLSLTEMPLTITVSGAGAGGATRVSIERASSYYMDRPDGNIFNGYEGETVALVTQSGDAAISIGPGDLIGRLDDGAAYRMIAEVSDGYGQSAQDTLEFEVHWSHQALMPDAAVNIDSENLIAVITPSAPTGAAPTDVCDIYRLSADHPELIVQDGVFGTAYVDPYPAIGGYGGHRVVFKTANGDYITADNHPAWIDLDSDANDILDIDYAVIDFNGDQLRLRYNVELSSAWKKDFKETKYLGGSVRGDWNPAVSRTGSIKAVCVADNEPETIKALRELAAYSGICHVRTQDGSSYAADIQVTSDVSYEQAGKVLTFSLSITRVDTEGFDGLTYAEWLREHGEE